MPILTKSGRVVIAESIALRPIHLAWGTGDGAWTTPPAEDADAEIVLNEIGRRQATEVSYVVPDVDGDIILPTGTFSRSDDPTNHLFVVTNFEFEDAPSSIIRNVGIFVGSTMVGGLPGGQRYFEPAEVATPGRLMHLENIAPIYRSPAIRENFQIVISF